MLSSLFGSLFGWGRKIRKLRKRWDRLREKTLKKEPRMRAILLSKEDQIEQSIAALEERRLTRAERARLARAVELDMAEVRAMLKEKPMSSRGRRSRHPYSSARKKRKSSSDADSVTIYHSSAYAQRE